MGDEREKVNSTLFEPAPIRRLSASAIETWDLCKAKWGFRYLDGVADPGTTATELGTRVHSVLERYLTTGEIAFDTPEGCIAQPGVEFLPEPGALRMTLEREFELKTARTHWKGFIDVFVAPLSEFGAYVKPPLILDHKTTSAVKWAKTPETLRTNNQALLYAYYAIAPESEGGAGYDATSVDLRWVYYQTKGARKAHPVDLTLQRSEILDGFGNLEKKALQLYREVSTVSTGNDLPKSPDACKAFGGCPYFGNVCKTSRKERFQAMASYNLKDLLGKPSGDADHAPKPKATAPAPAAETPATVAQKFPAAAAELAAEALHAIVIDPVTGAKITEEQRRRVYGWTGDGTRLLTKDEHGRVAADLQDRPLPPQVIATQRVTDPATGGMHWIRPCTEFVAGLLALAADEYAAADPQLQVNPPEFQPPPDAPDDEDAPALVDPLATTEPPPAAETKEAPAAETKEAPAAETPAKRGPGRPKKDPSAPAKPRRAPDAREDAEAPSVAEYHQGAQGEPAAESVPLVSKNGILVLYVGCYPRKGKNTPVDLAAYVARAHEALEIDHWSLAEFGKGRGCLSGAVAELVTEDLAKTKTLAIHLPRMEESQICYSALYALADLVVSAD